MIKLPKEVNKLMSIVEQEGFHIYAAGDCVRDSLAGGTPVDWDLLTDAPLDVLKKLPEGEVISEKSAVVRFDYTTEENPEAPIVDVASADIEKVLAGKGFTVCAMAESLQGDFIDNYGGRDDVKKKLIRTIGEPKELFEREPLYMFRAVRLAAEMGFDISKDIYEAILAKEELAAGVEKSKIREEFGRLMEAPFVGKGLKLLVGCGLVPYVIGMDTAKKLSSREIANLEGLAAGLEKTKCVRERRLGMFYLCFEKKRADSAIEYLEYDNELRQHLFDGVHLQETLYFMRNEVDLKDFLLEYGLERYDYVHNLSKAYVIVYGSPDIKIKNRLYLMDEITRKREPVYIEDLKITGEDLIESGIAEGEKVGELLLMLAKHVHRKPEDNNREALMENARKLAKNRLFKATKKVQWLR